MEKNKISARKRDQYFWHFIYSVLFIVLVGLALSYLKENGAWPRKIPTFDFILLSLATFRLIRLFTYDLVTNFIRDHFKQYEGGPGRVMWHLLDCPWCSGVWFALAVTFFYFATPLAWYPILILAVAGVATFIQITILKIGHGL
jgi:hypothetical protein